MYATSVTLAVLNPELPRTVLAPICAILVITNPLSLTVTYPSVTVNCAVSKLDKPLAACLTAAVPVGADALALAKIINNLLCMISAVEFISALIITFGLICASIVCAVESIFNERSPTIAAFSIVFPTPVNTAISLAEILPKLISCKLPINTLLKFTASCGLVGSVTFIILC